jgi:entericidin B
MFQRIFAALIILGFLGTIMGCNTIAGMGKDIERGGDAIEHTAKDAQKKM